MKVASTVLWITLLSGVLLGVSVKRLAPDTPPPTDVCPESMICYEPYGAPVEAKYFLNGSIILVSFIDAADMPDGVEAYAQYAADFENNLSFCVITAVIPEQVLGDPRMDALGHELLHCITGAFHP